MSEERDSSKKVVKGLFWAYLENIAVQFVGFLVSVILARILSPDDYGTISLVMVFISIANVFVTSSFSYALVQNKQSDELDYNTMYWFSQAISIVLFSIIFFCAPLIANYYNNSELTLIIRVLSIRIPLSAYNSIQMAHVSRNLAFRKSFLTNSGGALISAVIGIVLAYSGGGIWALVAQNISQVVGSTFFMMLAVSWRPKWMFSFERLKTMYSFGWKLLVTGLLATGYSELRALVIGKKYSTADLGYYDKGYTFPKFIAANIDSTITRVLFPTLSKHQENQDEMKLMTRRAIKTSNYIMTPVLFGLALLAEPVVHLLLTDKWLPCVPYLQIMCFVWWLQPVQSCSIQALKATGRSDLYLKVEIVSKIIGILLLVVTVNIFHSVIAIAYSMLIGQVVSLILYTLATQKVTGYTLIEQGLDLLIPCVLSVVMCIIVWLIGQIIHHVVVSLILSVLCGATTYCLVSYLFKVEEFRYLKGVIVKLIVRK